MYEIVNVFFPTNQSFYESIVESKGKYVFWKYWKDSIEIESILKNPFLTERIQIWLPIQFFWFYRLKENIVLTFHDFSSYTVYLKIMWKNVKNKYIIVNSMKQFASDSVCNYLGYQPVFEIC